MTKLIVIIGITGNQGGSVAERFHKDPNYRIRGLTRNPSSPAALALSAKGIEIVAADLSSVPSLVSAFRGANLIFSVTNYWEPFFRPDCRAEAEKKGITCRQHAYDVELQQGKNIADAAATPEVCDGLDEVGLVASTLSYAKECSKGRYERLYHFDAKAEVWPGYVEREHRQLAAKTTYVQTGFFTSSWKLAPGAYFGKQQDGTYTMSFPTTPHAPVPMVCINADLGNFVYAAIQLGPGKHFMAESGSPSWTEFMALWSKVTGKTGRYQEISLEQMVEATPDRMFGEEIADMYAYSSEPGYDGGDKSLIKAKDIREMGVECPMTSLEDWMRAEDWSLVFEQ